MVVSSDNTGILQLSLALECVALILLLSGAEAATRKGATKNFDQHSLVHGMWKRFAELKVGVWVMRVPTDENIADCPSRCGFCISMLCCKRMVIGCQGTVRAPGDARCSGDASVLGSSIYECAVMGIVVHQRCA